MTTSNQLGLESEWDGHAGAPRRSQRRAAGSSKQGARPMPRHSKDTIALLGIDIGKNTFRRAGLDTGATH